MRSAIPLSPSMVTSSVIPAYGCAARSPTARSSLPYVMLTDNSVTFADHDDNAF